MMFFRDTRSVGLILWIVVILTQLSAAIIFLGLFFDNLIELPDQVTDDTMYVLFVGGAAVISAVIFAVIAHKTMSGPLPKTKVLKNYVMAVGASAVIAGILGGLAVYMYTSEPRSGIEITIVSIVLGIIAILMQTAIDNGKTGALKKVIWVVLIIAFLLMALDAVLPADNYWEYASHVAHLILAFFMVAFITDHDVMVEMGVIS